MTITAINFSLTDTIKEKFYNLEDELKKTFKLNTEIKFVVSREVPNQLRIDIQAIFNGSVIKTHAIAKRFDFAFKKSKQAFIQEVIKCLNTYQP